MREYTINPNTLNPVQKFGLKTMKAADKVADKVKDPLMAAGIGFGTSLGVIASGMAKRVAENSSLKNLLTTAKDPHAVENSAREAVNVASWVASKAKSKIKSFAELPTMSPVMANSVSALAGGVAGTLGTLGAISLANHLKKKSSSDKIKSDEEERQKELEAQRKREYNSARLRVLEDAGLANPEDYKDLAYPAELNKYVSKSIAKGNDFAIEDVTKVASNIFGKLKDTVGGLRKASGINKATSSILSTAAERAKVATDKLYSGPKKTFNTWDKIKAVNPFSSSARQKSTDKIVGATVDNITGASKKALGNLTKSAERHAEKANIIAEQMKGVKDKTQLDALNSEMQKHIKQANTRLNIQESASNLLGDLGNAAKEHSTFVKKAAGAVRERQITRRMEAQAELQRQRNQQYQQRNVG